MKKALLLVALMVFSTPAFADSGFDNFSHQFNSKTEHQAKKHKGKSESSGNYCMPSEIRAILDNVRSLFGQINILSTHRPGAKIAGTNKASYHSSCRAVDFVPPKNKYKEVAAYLKSNWKGGVGTYSGRFRHIHVDTGPTVRFHKG
jgi:uncharacterized protein YcbK (DUF882 family)